MAKIVVYEDSQIDATNRYSVLTTKHEVHVWLSLAPLIDLEEERFVSAGFKLENIHDNHGDPSKESADVYFVDGLGGDYQRIMSRLPREKSFLNSGSPSTMAHARASGFQVLETSLEDAIEQALKSLK